MIQAAGTDAQKRFTDCQDDSPDKHVDYYLKAAEGVAEEYLVRTLCERAPEIISWLEGLGMEWSTVCGGYQIPYEAAESLVPRIHKPDAPDGMGGGAYLVDLMFTNARDQGVEFNFDCSAKKLIYDTERGVLGVQVEQDGATRNIKAERGVVLALGGMDHNMEMAKAYNPQQLWDLTTQISSVTPFSVGDGIRMGQEINAALASVGGTIDFDYQTFAGTYDSIPIIPCIYVNGNGVRFVAEDATCSYMLRAIFQQEMQIGKPTYMIMDQHMVELGVGPWAESPDTAVSEGSLVKGETLDEIARQIDVDPASLKRTVERWNESAQAGSDECFARINQLIALDKPPYYARKNVLNNLGSLGGLRINEQAQVVDNNGDVIPRLFAGGMNSGGWYGPYYPGSGTSIVGGLAFGRIAGEQAADTEAWSA